jgi:DNA-binding transcriptional ArsR family regulator
LAKGIDEIGMKSKLEAATRLVPYIRLVERERLRARFRTAEEYEAYFNTDEVDRLFHELIADKLTISRIMGLLREKPRSTGEISEILGISPSEVSRHLGISAKQGLARFDESQKRFVAA